MSHTAPAARPWLLPALMMLGALVGVALGTAFAPLWESAPSGGFVIGVGLLGTIFLSVLKALVVPLIVSSVIVAVYEVGTASRVARLAWNTAAYFVCTTLLAVVTGLVLVTLIDPGVGHGGTAAAAPDGVARSLPEALASLAQSLFPANLIEAAGHGHGADGSVQAGNVLGLIVFSLFFGAALLKLGARAKPLADALRGVEQALFVLVRWVVWLAPVGIAGLVADRLGRAGGGAAAWEEVQRLGSYALTVLLGLAVHAGVTLPLVLWFVARRSAMRYAAGMSEALLTAFGTASSAATLAITRRGVVERNGVSGRSADFVLPIGATVNMDGTALYEAVAVVFIAQSLGIELDAVQLLLVALTATLAAIGAAAIPQAGLVTMVLVLDAVGLPAEGIGLLLSIDWILDRFRTAVNVWGDAIGAAVVERIAAPALVAAEAAEPGA
jgi:solute carrier family 1 (high affinity glutamate transporter) protein 1